MLQVTETQFKADSKLSLQAVIRITLQLVRLVPETVFRLVFLPIGIH